MQETQGAPGWRLWHGLFAGPVAFLLNLQINYMLVDWACANRGRWVLFSVAAIAILLAMSGGAASWHAWRVAGKDWPGESPGIIARDRLLAVSGLMSSAMFLAVLWAQAVAFFFLGPCQR